MNHIIVTDPRTRQKITLSSEAELRDFLVGYFSFKDTRQFQLGSLAQKATFGQMRELLDKYDIPYEFAS